MNGYIVVLYTHSYLRWVLLALACGLCIACARARRGDGEWTRAHERLHVAFVGAFDLQFTLGLILYLWLSPYARAFYANPGAGMKDATLRFFGVEHVFSMLIAISIVHIGRVRSKRVHGAARHRRVLLFTIALLVLLLIAIPWPFLPYARPLLRGL